MRNAAIIGIALALVAGCSSAPRQDGARKPAYYSDDGPPDDVPAFVATLPDAVPVDEPFHRFANRPYTVFGRTYVPVVNKAPAKERGIASWYGKKFHGQKTASGEVYDMFRMTAAHKTYPLPSYAKVTNVRTGQSVVVRVNDRVPFHEGRVIDLSYAAAHRIGIAQAGSGLVDVERVFGDSPAAPAREAPPAPPPPIEARRDDTRASPVVTAEAGGLWLQLGAFSSAENAETFRNHIATGLSWLLEPITIAPREGLHRVRLGPYRNREEANAIAEKIRSTLGVSAVLQSR